MKLAACMAALSLALTATGAMAHIGLEQPQAKIGAPYKAVFKVPHGCKGSATVEIRVDVPEGVIGVKPMPKPGWVIELVKGSYARPYNFYHGAKLSEGVRQITWRGGPLPDDYYDEFVLSTFIAGELTPGKLTFPVTQKCETGEMRWSEIAAEGQDPHALEFPAPQLTLVAGDAPAASKLTVGDLTLEGPWVRAIPDGAKVTAGYVKITNSGNAPDVLLGGTSAGAEAVELHETTTSADGVSGMRSLPDGVAINPGETVELKPMGGHIMVLGLKDDLKEGQTLSIKLNFKNAGPVEVPFSVRTGAPMAGHIH